MVLRLAGLAMCHDEALKRFILLKKQSPEQEHDTLSTETPENDTLSIETRASPGLV